MEKKSKIITVLAAGAILLLVASSVARCAIVHDGQGKREEPPSSSEKSIQASFSEWEYTDWENEAKTSKLSILPNVMIESVDGQEVLYQSSVSDFTGSDGSFKGTLSLMNRETGEHVSGPIAISKTSAGYELFCDCLHDDYLLPAGSATGIELADLDPQLSELLGKSQDEIASAVTKAASKRSPQATRAAWSKEVWISYADGIYTTTFILDDASGSVVTLTLSGDGVLEAS